jgi:diketogulonate reductase-like aldo/keto reductase
MFVSSIVRTMNARMHRRALLCLSGAALWLPARAQAPADGAASPAAATRPAPALAGGGTLPRVGLGSWITFNVGNDAAARVQCTDVMAAFFAAGGRLIDSSPMYGSSQDVIGAALKQLNMLQRVFSADKVWITPAARGPAQIEASRGLWGVPRFDLLQVHNLLSWQEHLPVLLEMKAAGKLRYVGVTTSEGRRMRDVEQIMRSQPIDFVQVTYSLADRRAEDRILPLARERGIAVIANRPFEQGELLRALARHALPPVAADLQCTSWAQFALKFVVSHPAVTCAIPATTSVAHVRENMAAGTTNLPDLGLRNRMAAQTASLL